MESSNLSHHHHHHQHQQQQQLHDHHDHTHLLVSSSSSSSLAATSPSCFGLAQTTPLHPTSSSINLMSHVNFMNPNRLQQNDLTGPNSLNNITSMAQDFGYHQYWGCGDLVGGVGGLNSNNNNNNNGHDYGSSSSSSDSYPKFTELLLQSSSTNNSSLGQDLNMQPTSYDHLYSSNMIFPTINVSSLNQQSTLEMNLEALDLFSNCGRFAAGHGDDHHNNLSNLYRSADHHSSLISSYGVIPPHLQQHQQSSHASRPSNSSINTSTKLSEAANFRLIENGDHDEHDDHHRVKRPGALIMSSDDDHHHHDHHPGRGRGRGRGSSSSFSEPNLMKPNNNDINSLSHHPPPQKKSRSDSRASCPPFKVRKEKLGDRIAALQQLVAPFGKTDTASVLMEVIGYIKFLQNQIETLSVPYMKSSRNKQTDRTRHQANPEDQLDNKQKEELAAGGRGLRSRGLCLVPLSCSSYVTPDGSGGCIWPANFN